ncbi:hypothetical protein [Calothrix rhizosoleniae]|uniref:hypothetical protein n=1 Tax=Calothrix rhizosoleniae TaxID=888997 RepID=UPI000B49FABB|nr:hypothetical protein [Calothrix rhizosoleniae]
MNKNKKTDRKKQGEKGAEGRGNAIFPLLWSVAKQGFKPSEVALDEETHKTTLLSKFIHGSSPAPLPLCDN